MLVTGLPFKEVARQIERLLPNTHAIIPRATDPGDNSKQATALWASGRQLSGTDPASKFLIKRGLACRHWPIELRWHPQQRYTEVGGGSESWHPAMLARFLGSDGRSFTVHKTYLTNDGHKASVGGDVRKFLQGKTPTGGAVRLFPSGPVLGIAEGVETAIAASIIHDVPVWAALNDGNVSKFQPPAEVQQLLIFGDADQSGAGQLGAWSIYRHLTAKGLSCEVCLPDRLPNDGKGTDWNDVLLARQLEPASAAAQPRTVADDEEEAILVRFFGKAPPDADDFEEVVL